MESDITIVGAGFSGIYIANWIKRNHTASDITVVHNGMGATVLFGGATAGPPPANNIIENLNSIIKIDLLKLTPFDPPIPLFTELGTTKFSTGVIEACLPGWHSTDEIDGLSIFYPVDFRSWMVDVLIRAIRNSGLDVEVLPLNSLQIVKALVCDKSYIQQKDVSKKVIDDLINEMFHQGCSARYPSILTPPFVDLDIFQSIKKLLEEKDRHPFMPVISTSTLLGDFIADSFSDFLKETKVRVLKDSVSSIEISKKNLHILTLTGKRIETEVLILCIGRVNNRTINIRTERDDLPVDARSSVNENFLLLDRFGEILHPTLYLFNPGGSLFEVLSWVEEFLQGLKL